MVLLAFLVLPKISPVKSKATPLSYIYWGNFPKSLFIPIFFSFGPLFPHFPGWIGSFSFRSIGGLNLGYKGALEFRFTLPREGPFFLWALIRGWVRAPYPFFSRFFPFWGFQTLWGFFILRGPPLRPPIIF